MKDIPDGSVDMVLADLPYGTTACKWDTCIPFEPLWEQYKRIIKSNGVIVLFGSEPFSSRLRMSNIRWFKYDWIWRKPKGTGHLNANKQPLRDAENISVFYNRQCVYNPQMGTGAPYKNKAGKDHSLKKSMSECYGEYTDYRPNNFGVRYPKQIIEFPIVERGNLHPTQKPVALLEYLIRTYTNEGETILDNTMGSGSTGVAAANTGRNFIGMELDPGYFETACKRISEAEEAVKCSNRY